MLVGEDFVAFIAKHAQEDVNKLRLKRYTECSFDVELAIEQIEIRKKAKQKLPSWASNSSLLFPSGLSFEQCSSELTARYKQRFCNGSLLCDLTGGLGIDSLAFAGVFDNVTYVERYPNYCEAAIHNFEQVGATHIQVVNSDCATYINSTTACYDTIYLDPARRGVENSRLFALSDYEPNIDTLLPTLLQRSKQVVMKVSPMVDITQMIVAIPQISEVHVLSVKNECKELLLVITPETKSDVQLFCINYNTLGEYDEFTYSFNEERQSEGVSYANTVSTYLYEPNSSLLKAGAFKQVASVYSIAKLHMHSHLYTSEAFLPQFNGRQFQVKEVIPFRSKEIKGIKKSYPKANITTRNFPLSVKEIRQKTGIKEGGEIYLFATTTSDEQHQLIVCEKII